MTPRPQPQTPPGDLDPLGALRDVLAGRLERYAVVVRCYEETVRRCLCARLAWDADVDDLVQRTFVTAYHGLDRFERGGDLGAWLRGIARNLLREEARARAREARRHRGYGQLRPLLEEAAVADDRADVRLEALRRCRERLDEADRALLRLRYDEGLSTVEIGVQLGCSAGAVKTRLYALRRRLRDGIARELGERR